MIYQVSYNCSTNHVQDSFHCCFDVTYRSIASIPWVAIRAYRFTSLFTNPSSFNYSSWLLNFSSGGWPLLAPPKPAP